MGLASISLIIIREYKKMNRHTPLGIWKSTYDGLEVYLSFDNPRGDLKAGFYKKFIKDGVSLSREGGSWCAKTMSLKMLPLAVEGEHASQAGVEKCFQIAYLKTGSIRIIDIIKAGEIKTYDFHKIEEWPFEE